jgi:hypothetical protein
MDHRWVVCHPVGQASEERCPTSEGWVHHGLLQLIIFFYHKMLQIAYLWNLLRSYEPYEPYRVCISSYSIMYVFLHFSITSCPRFDAIAVVFFWLMDLLRGTFGPTRFAFHRSAWRLYHLAIFLSDSAWQNECQACGQLNIPIDMSPKIVCNRTVYRPLLWTCISTILLNDFLGAMAHNGYNISSLWWNLWRYYKMLGFFAGM